jgi:hypothetical protein
MRTSTTILGAAAIAVLAVFPAAAQEKIGVAACDDFLAKFDVCAAKMPAQQQTLFKGQIDQLRGGWKAMAGNAQTKPQLEGVCTQMAASMKAATASTGCAW